MTSAGDHLVDFEAGQLSALAGFSPLRHFDLYLVGVYQIFRVDSESSRGHLLDRTAGRSPVGTRLVTFPGSSPPSPVLMRPPMRFIATAIASCASRLIEPYDIAPDTNAA